MRRPTPVRPPAVAGLFYPADGGQCRHLAGELLQAAGDPAESTHWLGGLAPHAGWMCSGAIAARTVGTLARQGSVDVVVIFGAVHTPLPLDRAALDSHERWRVPGGDSHLPLELQGELARQEEWFVVDERYHRQEHAVEVLLPLVQLSWPEAAVLPVEVPALDHAVQIGQRTAQVLQHNGLRPVYLASSDLTHYGPNYRFAPAGVGPQGLAWARDNDRRLLDLICQLRSERIVPEALRHGNACGSGAISAMLSACKEHGARSARLLHYGSSAQVLADLSPQENQNTVGYASILVGR